MSGRLFHLEGDWYEWRERHRLFGDVQLRVRVEAHDDGRLGLAELRVIGQPTSELLRAIPLGRMEAAANAQLTVVDDHIEPTPPRRRRPPNVTVTTNDLGWDMPVAPPVLRSASTRGRPDAFYREIATRYRVFARTSRRPAIDIAEKYGVPVTTAHRWIREARRRGYLPPGRPGKAG